MAIIKLTISDNLIDKILHFLNQFKGKGVEIELLDEGFEAHKEYVQEKLKEMESGKAKFVTLEELDQTLERTIRKYEG